MSEKLCTLRTKGGGGGATYTETVLWTNPSSSSDFAAQTVTLSDDINNYDYLKVSYKNLTTSAGVNDPYSVLISVSDFKTSLSGNSTRHNAFTFGGIYAPSNTNWTRFMFYDTDTTARFGACTQIGGTQSSNTNAIPLQIVGIKMNGTITPSTLDLGMPPNASGAWASVPAGGTKTIPVTQMPSFIFLIIIPNGGGVLTRLLNVETEICYQYSFYSSAWHLETVPDTDWTTRITSITDSSVTIKNKDTSNTQRMAVGIYY